MSNIPEWALKFKQKGTEIRCFNGKYYLYKVTSKWNPELKRSKKITEKMLGRITEADGFIESEKIRLERKSIINEVAVKENGFASFFDKELQDYGQLLKKHFPAEWQDILAVSYGRLLFQSPLKNMDFHFKNSFLSQKYTRTALSPNSIGAMLHGLGIKRERIVDFCREFNKLGGCILFDGSDFASQSGRMELPKEGRCKKGYFCSTVNAMFAFSVDQHLPVYYRLLPGNVKDVKSFRLSLEESGIKDALTIADKGFYSEKNVMMLEETGLKYVIPLKRNDAKIDYSPVQQGGKDAFAGYFCFEGRYVWYYKSANSAKAVWVFLDEDLKNRESRDYLSRIDGECEEYTIENFHRRQHQFGTVALMSNTSKTAEDVYVAYKSRGEIEQMIDVYKNILDADATYMQDESTLEGWMFCNYVALHWYYAIYRKLSAERLLNKYSPQDFIRFLVEIKKVRINGTWHNAEITKKTQTLLDKLDLPIT